MRDFVSFPHWRMPERGPSERTWRTKRVKRKREMMVEVRMIDIPNRVKRVNARIDAKVRIARVEATRAQPRAKNVKAARMKREKPKKDKTGRKARAANVLRNVTRTGRR